MKALDLFCGAGGTSTGLALVGFEVTGIDIKPQPNYPFKFIQMDALEIDEENFEEYDLIWASPPCQQFTRAKHLRDIQGYKTTALNLIPQTRELLRNCKVPSIIENVEGSPLRKDLMLCGSMFGLRVRRHRIFESSFFIEQPKCNHKIQGKPIGVYHRMKDKIPHGGHTANSLQEAREAMGINYMLWDELKESIPPKYSEYIAKCLLLLKNKKEEGSPPTFENVGIRA